MDDRQLLLQVLEEVKLPGDKTGIRLGGKNSWMHVISNGAASLFAHHPNRGKKAMDDMGILGLYKGTLVHDRSGSYFSYNCEHSLCMRDLVYVEEAFEAKRERDPDLKPSYYSRVFKKYTRLIRPVIKNMTKSSRRRTRSDRPLHWRNTSTCSSSS